MAQEFERAEPGWEQSSVSQGVDHERAERAVRELLLAIGEDPDREGLRETPARVARAYAEIFAGLHTVPFFGKAHIGYIPGESGKVIGLSKLARVVDLFAKRPQVQERLTRQVADALVTKLEPHGVIVVIECEHLCMAMRGIRKPGAATVTSAVRGGFAHSAKSRAEALSLIRE